jgi:hypothetical protein
MSRTKQAYEQLPDAERPDFLRRVIEYRTARGRKVPAWVMEALTALAKQAKEVRRMATRLANGKYYERASLSSKGA